MAKVSPGCEYALARFNGLYPEQVLLPMTMDHNNLTILSPCIGKCGLTRQDICKGCFRSLDEILNWEAMSEANRKVTLANCKQRRQQRSAAQRGF